MFINYYSICISYSVTHTKANKTDNQWGVKKYEKKKHVLSFPANWIFFLNVSAYWKDIIKDYDMGW